MHIKVDYEQLFRESAYLKQRADQYDEVIQRIYSRMHEMQTIWQGADNQAYIQKLEQFKPQLDKMRRIIEMYAIYLNRSATSYQAVVQDRILKAKQLA